MRIRLKKIGHINNRLTRENASFKRCVECQTVASTIGRNNLDHNYEYTSPLRVATRPWGLGACSARHRASPAFGLLRTTRSINSLRSLMVTSLALRANSTPNSYSQLLFMLVTPNSRYQLSMILTETVARNSTPKL